MARKLKVGDIVVVDSGHVDMGHVYGLIGEVMTYHTDGKSFPIRVYLGKCVYEYFEPDELYRLGSVND